MQPNQIPILELSTPEEKSERRFSGWIAAFVTKWHVALFLSLLCLSFVPFLLLGEGSYVTIHDNLDSHVPWLVLLAREGKMWAGGEIEQVMNGLPRSTFPSGLSVQALLFSVLPPFSAYLINHILVRLLAFLGMYRLLRRHLLVDGGVINSGVAFCFAMLPFYSMLGLSIAGQPLLLSAILSFQRRRAGRADLLIVALFPFYSRLIATGVFLLALLGLWLPIDALRRKRLNGALLLCLGLLGMGYVVVEWRLLRDILVQQSYVSHRIEFARFAAEESYGMVEVARRTFVNFLDGQYHAASLHRWILLLAVPAALAISFARNDRRRRTWLLGLLGLAFLFSFLLAVQHWRGLLPLKDRFELLHVFQFGRFHFLHPPLWFLLFALSLDTIWRSRLGDLGGGRRLAVLLLVGQSLFVVSHNDEVVITSGTLARRLLGSEDWRISYGEFYSERLFRRVADHIGRPQSDYRVASLGLHPVIAAYNGFHTLDYYMQSYPLSYKHEFRRIIARELEQNSRWRRYFDGWGCRCYLFASELPDVSIEKSAARPIRHLELGTGAFREMGGEYILSAVEIVNHAENGLALEGVFEEEGSPWRVWLYGFPSPAFVQSRPQGRSSSVSDIDAGGDR